MVSGNIKRGKKTIEPTYQENVKELTHIEVLELALDSSAVRIRLISSRRVLVADLTLKLLQTEYGLPTTSDPKTNT